MNEFIAPRVARIFISTCIPTYSRHVVNDRDKGACVLINENGHRCGQTKYTDMHHVVERSEGGSHDPSNLRTLCAFHHRLVHQMKVSREMQRNWVPEHPVH